MSERTRQPSAASTTETDAHARDAALEAWHEADPVPVSDPDFDYRPPKRTAFPPSFLLLLAGSLAFLALEPTGDLGYAMFGPARGIDLGRPGAYTLQVARNGARASIKGYPSDIRGSFSRWGDQYQVVPLIGVPVLVRRAAREPSPLESTEPFSAEGRLIRLEDSPSTFVDRLVDPTSRYSTVRLQFEALGEIPAGKPAWLLLDGELPRSDPRAIAVPLLLVLAVLTVNVRTPGAALVNGCTSRC